jgi:EAL domain-containing protein (putative c-di-GMP-specific phosphodiesterase class I)
MLPNIGDEKITVKIVHKIRNRLARPFTVNGHTLFVTAGIGVSFFPRDGSGAAELLKNAEAAMHRAKKLGNNTFQFYTNDINAEILSAIEFENDLRHALENNEFSLYYQPLVDLKTGKAIGAEALLRWKSPRHGNVSPLKIIPMMEETGLILPLGEWVLATACKQASIWNANGAAFKVAINLSAMQFKQADMIKTIVRILKETHCRGSDIELELTESMLMADTKDVIGKIQALRDLGISISIDDFGTGYSSLNYLKKFPINKIKIDKSFIGGVDTDPDDAAITRTIISLAKNLNLRVLAEGIENINQLNYLCDNACDEGQGYLFCEPTDADTCSKRVQDSRFFSRDTMNGIVTSKEP